MIALARSVPRRTGWLALLLGVALLAIIVAVARHDAHSSGLASSSAGAQKSSTRYPKRVIAELDGTFTVEWLPKPPANLDFIQPQRVPVVTRADDGSIDDGYRIEFGERARPKRPTRLTVDSKGGYNIEAMKFVVEVEWTVKPEPGKQWEGWLSQEYCEVVRTGR